MTDDSTLTPATHFVMAADGSSGLTAHGKGIPNIDSVKSTIRTYYGVANPSSPSANGIANRASSPYITEMQAIEAHILANMPTAPAPHLAVVFDADDTTLWTYDMEDGAMHFNFDPKLQNDEWVQKAKFPATPGMVDFVAAVQAKGYDVYGITGRTNDQEAATLTNLTNVGYTAFNADNFYTKWTAQPGGVALPQPDYVNCAADSDPVKCSTVEYKAATRKHIESLGETIVLNIGDQWSDLQGGHAMNSVKLPNPTYYLPSLDVADAPATDAQMTPKTEFDMLPDGSSGLTVGGENIPNIDSVKSTIRTYYGAPAGIANTETSPYISDLTNIENLWTKRLTNRCARGVAHGTKPAVVFDADDTTLWTYNMEDAAMHFNFDPTLQNTWVQEGRFPAVPGMPAVVNAAKAAGCKIIGLTGRNNAQRVATLDNLAKYYYDDNDNPLFKSQYYFTKWNSATGDTQPAYVDCAQDADATKCSTIEYKSSTRKYVEDHFGFHIIANFGDQFSDLIGQHADNVIKLPNPTYYLP
ncbi:putative secreted acid phosphatase [Nocardioides ginsengisegetis]|uniref:Putative secreted acid phosphatase n=1 Tax=Nocardioides ginsengisegetis TaxID=661491 RepID=A0A7W3P828_9ACTN|nr:HAD family acid phosphatase [Nocardioides ginsengisegetis]MBA8802125.1 putative secreted acid phosphatase [Nocardioides ginsengisegetis]